jgi:hypothetical protein
MTYKGYTVDQIKDVLEYNQEEGTFKSKISGKTLVGREFSYRDGKDVVKLQLSRVAYILSTNSYLKDEDRVLHKDNDPYNYKSDNLFVVPYQQVYDNKPNHDRNVYLETEYEHVYVGTMNRLFVVRRGLKQGVYRTYSKEEAVAVRDRWLESSKTLHEWDNFTPKWYKRMLENDEYLHILKENEEKCEFI